MVLCVLIADAFSLGKQKKPKNRKKPKKEKVPNLTPPSASSGDPGSTIWSENVVEGRRSEVPRCLGHRGGETIFGGFRALEVARMLSDARGMAPDDLGPAGRRKLN